MFTFGLPVLAQVVAPGPKPVEIHPITISRLEALAISVLAAVLFTLIVWAGKGIWLWVGENLFLKLTARHIPSVAGTWEGSYVASGGAYSYKETMVLTQYAWKLRGDIRFSDSTTDSATKDMSKVFHLAGILKGTVVTAYYWGKDKKLLGSGTFTLHVVNENTMKGGCVYFEPSAGTVMADMYEWRRSA